MTNEEKVGFAKVSNYLQLIVLLAVFLYAEPLHDEIAKHLVKILNAYFFQSNM